MPRLLATLKNTFQKALHAGTKGYSSPIKRQLRIINMVTYLIIVANLSYVVQYSVIDYETYKPLIILNVLITFLIIFVPFAHRLNKYAGAIWLIGVEYLAVFFLTAYLGTASGIHLQYFAGGAAPFFFFGIKKPYLPFTAIILALVLQIVCWFSFPPKSAMIHADSTMLNTLYIFASIATIGLISLSVYYAYLLVERAKQRVDSLLRTILPESIVAILEENPKQQIADLFDSASVLFLDLVGFTALSNEVGPRNIVRILNQIVSSLDELAKREGVEKIKTIGDAYMAVCGAPEPNPCHLEQMVKMAFQIPETVQQAAKKEGIEVNIRIGIAAGPVLAGIIGTDKFSYDVWGPTVNLASRMESSGAPGKIQVPDDVKCALEEKFYFENAGTKDIKGFGRLQTWYLIGLKNT